jgi:uncharacterized membrane protein YjgN (DUF898 family)
MNESLDQKIRLRNAVARAHTQAASGQTSRMMVKETPVYSGRVLQLLPIVLVNLVLTLLTVGIYRFWAKTRLRRYFLSRVSFLGDPLEYTGTGRELFLGFLIVLAVLVPFFFISGIVHSFMSRPGTDPIAALGFQATYLAMIFFLYNVAVYRAQRYRLSRTTWRGIRGGQQGSAMRYALYAIGLGLLTFVTLGLAYPVARHLLMGYRIDNASFGSDAFRFKGNFAPLFTAWLVPWALMVLAVAPAAFTLWMDGFESLTDTSGERPRFRFENIRYGLVVPIAAAGAVVANFWYRAKEVRHFATFTRFEALEIKSHLRGHQLFLPYLVYGVLFVLMVGAAIFVPLMLLAGNSLSTSMGLSSSEDAYNFGRYLGFGFVIFVWLVLAALKPIVVQNWIFRSLCRSLTLQGSFSPDRLFQNQYAIPQRGEGLADALDVDAF